jgi:hypothetical protein
LESITLATESPHNLAMLLRLDSDSSILGLYLLPMKAVAADEPERRM